MSEIVDPYSGADPDTPAAAQQRRPSKRRGGRPRNVDESPRKVVERTVALMKTGHDDRAALAALVNVDADDVPALVVATLDIAAITGPLDDIESVRGLDPMEAVVEAAMLVDKGDRFRAAWHVLSQVTDLPARVPANPVKAGAEFARAAQSLPEDRLVGLRAPLALLD